MAAGLPKIQRRRSSSAGSPTGSLAGDGGFAGGEDLEKVFEAGHGEDTFDGLRGGGEAQGDILLLQEVFGAHEGREGRRVHEGHAAHVDHDCAHALGVGGPLYGVLDFRGRVEVHLAAHRDDGVPFGVLVYADLKVRAGPLLLGPRDLAPGY
jgi:hypothetical protein